MRYANVRMCKCADNVRMCKYADVQMLDVRIETSSA